MCLDVWNEFSIISPTHDFKIVTRLQHVTPPLRAVSRAAEKNRMAETFPGRWRRRTLISSVYLFADCIENGHMPGDLHAIMSTPPWKYLKSSGGVWWNWRGKCQRKCRSLGRRDQEHNRPGRSIWWRHSNAISVHYVPWFGRQKNFECGGRWEEERWKAKTSPNTRTRYKGRLAAHPNDHAMVGFLLLSSPRMRESAGDLQLPQGRPKLPTSFMRSRSFLFELLTVKMLN